jgi:hypothetical protein
LLSYSDMSGFLRPSIQRLMALVKPVEAQIAARVVPRGVTNGVMGNNAVRPSSTLILKKVRPVPVQLEGLDLVVDSYSKGVYGAV